MKYIRTEDRIYDGSLFLREYTGWYFREESKIYAFTESDIVKQADTIEELCDEFVVVPDQNIKPFIATQFIHDGGSYTCSTIYGAIWTDKGLIYVAKMNEKGELELL